MLINQPFTEMLELQYICLFFKNFFGSYVQVYVQVLWLDASVLLMQLFYWYLLVLTWLLYKLKGGLMFIIQRIYNKGKPLPPNIVTKNRHVIFWIAKGELIKNFILKFLYWNLLHSTRWLFCTLPVFTGLWGNNLKLSKWCFYL